MSAILQIVTAGSAACLEFSGTHLSDSREGRLAGEDDELLERVRGASTGPASYCMPPPSSMG